MQGRLQQAGTIQPVLQFNKGAAIRDSVAALRR